MTDYDIHFTIDPSYISDQSALIKLFTTSSLFDTVRNITVNDFKILTDSSVMRQFNYDIDMLIGCISQHEYDIETQESILGAIHTNEFTIDHKNAYRLKKVFTEQTSYSILSDDFSYSDNIDTDYEFIIRNYSVPCINGYFSYYNIGKIFKGEGIETIGHKFILEFMNNTRLRARIKLVNSELEQLLERIVARHNS